MSRPASSTSIDATFNSADKSPKNLDRRQCSIAIASGGLLALGGFAGRARFRRFNSSPSTLRRLGKDIAPRASGNESRERKKREDRHTGRSRHHDGPQTLRRAASRRLSRLGRLSGRPALRKPRHRRAPAARSPWPGRPRTPFRTARVSISEFIVGTLETASASSPCRT